MRIRSVVAGTVALLAIGLFPTPASASARALFRLTDARLGEISGLAVGHRNPGLLYVQNDSGDSARFFALNAQTGTVQAECAVPDAVNHDWEDLATGPSGAGAASVWLADIGDNDGVRNSIQLYRVDEPVITGRACAVAEPQVWQLRYPDRPHDAESLIVDPITRRVYVVTKQVLGHSAVFEVPAAPSSTVQTLAEVAEVQFRPTGTPGGPNPVGQLTATGAAMSADGRLLAIRTYTDAYLWPVPDGNLAGALSRPATVLPLPAQPQGEGIAVAGSNLLVDSEQVGSAVYAVPIPTGRLSRPGTASATTSTTAASAATASAATASAATAAAAPLVGPPSPSASPVPEQGTVAKDGTAFIGAIALMAILAAAAAIGRWRRR